MFGVLGLHAPHGLMVFGITIHLLPNQPVDDIAASTEKSEPLDFSSPEQV